jgi:hypothetical protein
MGSINQFNISQIRDEYGLKIAVETGTFRGEGSRFLSQFFSKVYTVELIESCFRNLDFSDKPNIVSILGKSTEFLSNILVNEIDSPCLFWLDAHLPSHHHNQANSDDVEFPLEGELRTIKSVKNVERDYFIIDDLRIYEDGPFEGGNWPDRKNYSNTNGIQFIYDLFGSTHEIHKLYNSAGYIILVPKNI